MAFFQNKIGGELKNIGFFARNFGFLTDVGARWTVWWERIKIGAGINLCLIYV